MIYASLDLETGGLDPNKDPVLHVAVVIEDTEQDLCAVDKLPHIEVAFSRGLPLMLEGEAARMNAQLMKAIDSAKNGNTVYRGRPLRVRDPHDGWEMIKNFLDSYFKDGKVVLAGKNVGSFDRQFLPPSILKMVHHRSIDVGSVALGANTFMWSHNVPPSMSFLLRNEPTHDALLDAWDNIRVIRELTGEYGRGQGHTDSD